MLKPGMQLWDRAFQMSKGCHIHFQFAMLIRCQQIWTVCYAAKVKEERTYFLLYVKSIIIPQTHTAVKLNVTPLQASLIYTLKSEVVSWHLEIYIYIYTTYHKLACLPSF